MRIVVFVLMCVLVGACGQKGPLVLPEPPPQSEPDDEDTPTEEEDRRDP